MRGRMKRDQITQKELFQRYKKSTRWLHLARNPIGAAQSSMQVYIMGFNISGRPEGLWIARGANWLSVVDVINNPRFPVCCYLYGINMVRRPVKPIIHLRSEADYIKFDAKQPSYWLNLDYFDFEFLDRVTGKVISTDRKYKLVFNRLRRLSADEPIRNTLLRNNIIFTTARAARAGCTAYREMGIPTERFKYKDWNLISQKYSGIVFDYWSTSSPMIKYIWYQSLDTASGCLWDTVWTKTPLWYKLDDAHWVKYSAAIK